MIPVFLQLVNRIFRVHNLNEFEISGGEGDSYGRKRSS